MNTIIEKIRERVEREKEKQMDIWRDSTSEYALGMALDKIGVYNQILSFLSDLEKECEEKPKPKPYFFCKHGGVISKCSDCKRNHSNSPYRAEEIQNWFVPSVRGTKQCSDYITIEKSEKPKKGLHSGSLRKVDNPMKWMEDDAKELTPAEGDVFKEWGDNRKRLSRQVNGKGAS